MLLLQIFLVFYHYLYPSPQPLWVYVTARVVVASFLFMTGYGRTMSALKRSSSFSLFAVSSMMLRLNLFVSRPPLPHPTDAPSISLHLHAEGLLLSLLRQSIDAYAASHARLIPLVRSIL
jgi:hypothetical protein